MEALAWLEGMLESGQERRGSREACSGPGRLHRYRVRGGSSAKYVREEHTCVPRPPLQDGSAPFALSASVPSWSCLAPAFGELRPFVVREVCR